MTGQTKFELPLPMKVIYDQNLETWRKLDAMKPLLDLLAASKDPGTEEARRDLAEVLVEVLVTTNDILHRQTAMEAQLQDMAATIAALKPFLDRMARHLP